MKKLYKISFCLVSVLIIIFSVFPLSAFAVTLNYTVSYNKPEITENSFYAELLLYNPTTRDYHVKVVYVNSVVESDYSGGFYDMNMEYQLRFSNNYMDIVFDADNLEFSYFGVEIYDNNLTPLYFSGVENVNGTFRNKRLHGDYGEGYQCINFHVYGDACYVTNLISDVPSDANTEFSVVYGETQSLYTTLTNIGIIANQIYGTSENTYARVGQLVDLLNGIQNQNATQINKLIDLVDYVRIMAADLILIRDDLEKQYDELIEQGESLDDINSELYDVNERLNQIYYDIVLIRSSVSEIESYVVVTYYEVADIKVYVSEILEILNAGSDKEEPTTQDPTKFDNYYEVENELVGNGAEDVDGAVQVEMNNNAMSVIWNIVQRFLESHSKVIGFVLTILSFGLVALILGR